MFCISLLRYIWFNRLDLDNIIHRELIMTNWYWNCIEIGWFYVMFLCFYIYYEWSLLFGISYI